MTPRTIIRISAAVAIVCLIVIFSGFRGALAAFWGVGIEYVGLVLAAYVLAAGLGIAAIMTAFYLRARTIVRQ